MEYTNYPPQETATSPVNQPVQPQQGQPHAARGRGRRAYAAQQYDFNSPQLAPVYDQQPQYPAGQGFQQPAPQPVGGPTQPQYGQPQTYPQQSYQYGQEY